MLSCLLAQLSLKRLRGFPTNFENKFFLAQTRALDRSHITQKIFSVIILILKVEKINIGLMCC
jgi:hypothetical protein